jgi:peptidyl-prolyl cis-trans isomerase C
MQIGDRFRIRAAVALALCLFVVGCGGRGGKGGGVQDNGQEITGDGTAIVATVGGKPVTLAEANLLSAYWANSGSAEAQGVQNRRELQLRAIEHLIDQLVLAQEAERRGISVPDSVISQMLARWEGQFPDSATRAQKLAESQITREQVRQKFHTDMVVQDLVRQTVIDTIQVADPEIAAYYQAHPEFFETTEVHARHILKGTPPGAPPESLAAKRAAIDGLLQRVRAGEDFAEVARQNSDDPGSGPRGGDLGFFTRGRMVQPFADSAFALQPGQMSGVVQTQFGFHIIKVEERRNEGTRPLEQVSAAIRQFLKGQKTQQAVEALAQRLHGKAEIKRKVKS